MLEEQSNKSDWSKREIGAFWTKDSAKGKYLSGSIEVDELGVKKKMRVVMFPNRFKDNDKKPDYVLYISQDSESQSESQSESKVEVKPEVEEKKEIPDTLV
tara:strand:- start:74 stop:376 length:303 start_codon:yes stop_codon:yes gene_type:complete